MTSFIRCGSWGCCGGSGYASNDCAAMDAFMSCALIVFDCKRSYYTRSRLLLVASRSRWKCLRTMWTEMARPGYPWTIRFQSPTMQLQTTRKKVSMCLVKGRPKVSNQISFPPSGSTQASARCCSGLRRFSKEYSCDRIIRECSLSRPTASLVLIVSNKYICQSWWSSVRTLQVWTKSA